MTFCPWEKHSHIVLQVSHTRILVYPNEGRKCFGDVLVQRMLAAVMGLTWFAVTSTPINQCIRGYTMNRVGGIPSGAFPLTFSVVL
jgi:hypothetical protein